MTAGEPLESGWGPAAAPGDSLWNDFQQETARSFAELGRARGDRVERIAAELTMTDASTPRPFHNRAVLEQPIVDTERTVEANSEPSTAPRAKVRSCSTARGQLRTYAATASC